jgi:hypothetical protein
MACVAMVWAGRRLPDNGLGQPPAVPAMAWSVLGLVRPWNGPARWWTGHGLIRPSCAGHGLGRPHARPVMGWSGHGLRRPWSQIAMVWVGHSLCRQWAIPAMCWQSLGFRVHEPGRPCAGWPCPEWAGAGLTMCLSNHRLHLTSSGLTMI